MEKLRVFRNHFVSMSFSLLVNPDFMKIFFFKFFVRKRISSLFALLSSAGSLIAILYAFFSGSKPRISFLLLFALTMTLNLFSLISTMISPFLLLNLKSLLLTFDYIPA